MKLMAPVILPVSVSTGENKERLMALCWRESACTFAKGYSPPGSLVGWGDNGNAFGPFQIDKRYHKDFIVGELGRYAWALNANLPYDAKNQANYAAGILRDNRYWLRHHVTLAPELLERATYASYNAGPGAVSHALQTAGLGADPLVSVDTPTTGKDYSGYIFSLASILQKPEYQWIWN